MSAIALEWTRGALPDVLTTGGFLTPIRTPQPFTLNALLPDERELNEFGLTVWDGPTAKLVTAKPGTYSLTWLAVDFDFPAPAETRKLRVLRFGVRPTVPLRPIASLVTFNDRNLLRFGVHGAPLLRPANDREGRWAATVETSRRRLREVVTAAISKGPKPRLFGENIASSVLGELASALGLDPPQDAPPALWATPSPVAGPCRACRHANQETVDLQFEQLLACQFAFARPYDGRCDLVVPSKSSDTFRFEPYDGSNCTWASNALRSRE